MTIYPYFMLKRPTRLDEQCKVEDSRFMTTADPIPASTDPLGIALHSLRMSGMFYCRTHLSSPWGLALPPMPGCLWFHIVTRGQALLEIEDDQPRTLRSGELALVPHGRGHRMRSEPHAATPLVTDLPHDYISDRYAILHHGGDGPTTVLICGAVRLDHPSAYDLIRQLPACIHIESTSSAHYEWIDATLRLITAEATSLRPGGETVTTRLADSLVIQAIRAWIEKDHATFTGSLGALRDERIGQAVVLIQQHPGHPWTLASLASEVAMSRSAFAARFAEVIGEPAMAFVARWRMYVAMDRLRSDDVGVGQVSASLGYQSEAAFSRAFKRIVGISPSEAKSQNDAPVVPLTAPS